MRGTAGLLLLGGTGCCPAHRLKISSISSRFVERVQRAKGLNEFLYLKLPLKIVGLVQFSLGSDSFMEHIHGHLTAFERALEFTCLLFSCTVPTTFYSHL